MSGDFCEVCGRVFDLTNEVDAHDFKNGHMCDALISQDTYALDKFHHGQDDDDDMEFYEIECLREDIQFDLEAESLAKDIDENSEFCVEHQMFFDDCECAFEI
jgi:hypothetical protein